MEDPNKPGRPRREWLDDVRVIEWCNMNIYNTFRVAQDRELWAAIVRRSSGHQRDLDH